MKILIILLIFVDIGKIILIVKLIFVLMNIYIWKHDQQYVCMEKIKQRLQNEVDHDLQSVLNVCDKEMSIKN